MSYSPKFFGNNLGEIVENEKKVTAVKKQQLPKK